MKTNAPVVAMLKKEKNKLVIKARGLVRLKTGVRIYSEREARRVLN